MAFYTIEPKNWVPKLWLFLVMLFIHVNSWPFLLGIPNSLISKKVSKNNVGMAVSLMTIFNSLASITGPLFASFTEQYLGIRFTFQFLLAFYLVLSLLFFFAFASLKVESQLPNLLSINTINDESQEKDMSLKKI